MWDLGSYLVIKDPLLKKTRFLGERKLFISSELSKDELAGS